MWISLCCQSALVLLLGREGPVSKNRIDQNIIQCNLLFLMLNHKGDGGYNDDDNDDDVDDDDDHSEIK